MSAPGPLDGVIVLDLGQIYAGPYAAFLMAMAGATVIKVEPPGSGENLRGRGKAGDSLPFVMLNRNKLGVSINLKDARGRDLLMSLVEKADVLVENFAPGVLDRLGCGWSVLSERNSRLIYASSTGYGLSGPRRGQLAMDLTVQAMSGVIACTGFPEHPPVKAGPAISDFLAGVHLFGGVMAALFERTRTGRGRLVEVSMLEATFPTLSSGLAMWHASGGKAPLQTGNRHSSLAEAPYNVYPASDGYVAIICVNENHWRSLCEAMNRPDMVEDARFLTRLARASRIDELDKLISAWTSTWPRDALAGQLNQHDVPNAPVRDLAEVVCDPHLHERGSLQWVDHPQLGRIVVMGSPIRFAGSESLDFKSSVSVGGNNEEVFVGMLGRTKTELEALCLDGVI